MKLQEPGIIIYGRYDDPIVTLCQSVVEIISKESKLKFVFDLYSETQFNSFREKLIINDQKILELQDSPIFYQVDENRRESLLGNHERFLKWVSKNFQYFEDRKIDSFLEQTTLNLKKLYSRKEFRYVYFNFEIGNIYPLIIRWKTTRTCRFRIILRKVP